MNTLLVANPRSTRAQAFAQACPGPVQIVSYATLLKDPNHLLAHPNEPTIVRLDSFGQDQQVLMQLLALGQAGAEAWGTCQVIDPQWAMTKPRDAIGAPRQQHLGFVCLLRQLKAVFQQRPAWRILTPPEVLETLFDKNRTQTLYARARLSVPEHLEAPPHEPRALIEAISDWPGAFIKLTCGSSASCLAHFRRGTLTTAMEPCEYGFRNSRGLRRFRDPDTIHRILAFLMGEGSRVERAIPKAEIHGMPFDLRCVAIDGRPSVFVVRENDGPITNLQAGGRRGDLDALKERVPEALWNQMVEAVAKVAEIHAPAFQVGVDVLLERSFFGYRILETNAFGDWFPNLRIDGQTVFELEASGLGATTGI